MPKYMMCTEDWDILGTTSQEGHNQGMESLTVPNMHDMVAATDEAHVLPRYLRPEAVVGVVAGDGKVQIS
jgi:hypothetical protein